MNPPWEPITDRTKTAVIRGLADGVAPAVIAHEHDLTTARVLDLAKHHGYPDRSRLTWAAEVLESALETSAAYKAAPGAPRADLAALIARGSKSKRAATRRLATRLKAAAAALTTALDEEKAAAEAAKEAAEREAAERAARAEHDAAVLAEIAEHERKAAELRATLTGATKASRSAGQKSGADPKAVRAWAAENGVECSVRGRIAGDVVAKYLAAVTA